MQVRVIKMKYILPIIIIALAFIVILSGCVSQKDNNINKDEEQLTKSIGDLNKNSSNLENEEATISQDLEELNTENDTNLEIEDPDLQQIDAETKELDSLIQNDYSDPLADLN